MSTSILELIRLFRIEFDTIPGSENPNWIDVDFMLKQPGYKEYVHEDRVRYDFKCQLARRRFGALCQAIYKSNEEWTITTAKWFDPRKANNSSCKPS